MSLFPSSLPRMKLFNCSICVRPAIAICNSNFLLGPFISFHFFCQFCYFHFSFRRSFGTFGSERRRKKKYLDKFECDMTWWRWLCCYFGCLWVRALQLRMSWNNCLVLLRRFGMLISCYFITENLHFPFSLEKWQIECVYVCVRPCVNEWRINYAMLSVIIQ